MAAEALIVEDAYQKGYIDVDSTFMQLAIGDNMFRYDAASGVNSLEVSIFYSKEFLGV